MSTWLDFCACSKFTIGKHQAIELFGPAADIDSANEYRGNRKLPYVERFLVRVLVNEDGTYHDMQFLGWFSIPEAALEIMRIEASWERRFGHRCFFELFHIMDDGELWDKWEFNSARNLLVELYPDGTVIDHECNVVFDATENIVDLLGCELCNDVEYGPWIRYYLPGLGFRYVCECCEPKAKKLGGVYVSQQTERACRRFHTVPPETLVI